MKPPGQWNDYHIAAKGQHITLSINGVKCSELIDQEEGHFDLKGLLGLQLRAGDPMTVQFKDIFLKRDKSANQTASRNSGRNVQNNGSRLGLPSASSRASLAGPPPIAVQAHTASCVTTILPRITQGYLSNQGSHLRKRTAQRDGTFTAAAPAPRGHYGTPVPSRVATTVEGQAPDDAPGRTGGRFAPHLMQREPV